MRLCLRVAVVVVVVVEERKIVGKGHRVEEIWDDAVAVAAAGSRPYFLGARRNVLSEVVPDFLFLGSKAGPDGLAVGNWQLAIGRQTDNPGVPQKKSGDDIDQGRSLFYSPTPAETLWLFKRTTRMSRRESV